MNSVAMSTNGAGGESVLRNGDGRLPELIDQWHSQPRTLRIIHVGAGATGLCAAWKMERQLDNYELVCYEKNPEIGGTWLESEYVWLEDGILRILTDLRPLSWLRLRYVRNNTVNPLICYG